MREKFEAWYFDNWSHGETTPVHIAHKEGCWQAWQAALQSNKHPAYVPPPKTGKGYNLFRANGGTDEQWDNPTQKSNAKSCCSGEAFHSHDCPSQPSVSCCRCGKAMEDRGAAYQWCGECCDKVAKA